MPSDFLSMPNLEQNFFSKTQCPGPETSLSARPGFGSGNTESLSAGRQEFSNTLQRASNRQKHLKSETHSEKEKAVAVAETDGDAANNPPSADGSPRCENLIGSNHRLSAEEGKKGAQADLKGADSNTTLHLLKALAGKLLEINPHEPSAAQGGAQSDMQSSDSSQIFQNEQLNQLLALLQSAGGASPSPGMQAFAEILKISAADASPAPILNPELVKQLQTLMSQVQAPNAIGQAQAFALKMLLDTPQNAGQINLNDILKALGADADAAATQSPKPAPAGEATDTGGKAEDFVKHFLAKLESESQAKAAVSSETANTGYPAKRAGQRASAQIPLQTDAAQGMPAEDGAKGPLRMNLNIKAGGDANDAGQNAWSDESSAKKGAQAPAVNFIKTAADILTSAGNDSKVISADIGNKDAGQVLGANPMEQLKTENQISAKATEFVQKEMPSQTLNQIVQKAVLHLNNGQNEIRIDLKPEFLGQLRMQIITESHQVTVKIIAESHFVKDLIENNFFQLKQDLQNQGLKVDQLEVSVANDADQRHPENQKSVQAKMQNQAGRSHKQDNNATDESITNLSGATAGGAETGIDLRV